MVLKDEYMKERRLAEIRLKEQPQSGTIVIDKGCVKLTEWGQFVATTTWFRQILLPKSRLIGDAYNSDLTNPMQNGVRRTDYLFK